jgi:hypothetical protein
MRERILKDVKATSTGTRRCKKGIFYKGTIVETMITPVAMPLEKNFRNNKRHN